MSRALYRTIITITEDYLGPAATRFINRIAINHLHKSAAELTEDDIPQLVTWVQLAANVLTENRAEIDEYVARLEEIGQKVPSGASGSLKHASASS